MSMTTNRLEERQKLTPYRFKELCERLKTNPIEQEAWLELFGERLSNSICIVVIKRYNSAYESCLEYLACVV